MKKIILFTSLALVIMFSILILFVDILNYDFCSRDCINTGESFFFFPLVFFFSLITYFTPDRIFQSWWKFARIAIPVLFIPILLINLEVHHSQHGELQGILDIPALILLYSIFSIGSIWQIWKGWRNKY